MTTLCEVKIVVYGLTEDELYETDVFYLCRRKDLDDFTKHAMVLVDRPITQSVGELKAGIKKMTSDWIKKY